MPKCCALQKFLLGVSLSLLRLWMTWENGQTQFLWRGQNYHGPIGWVVGQCPQGSGLSGARKHLMGPAAQSAWHHQCPQRGAFARPLPSNTPQQMRWSCSQITRNFVPIEVGHSTSKFELCTICKVLHNSLQNPSRNKHVKEVSDLPCLIRNRLIPQHNFATLQYQGLYVLLTWIHTMGASIHCRKLDDTCKFLEAYQDSDALNKVSAIQVAIYTICRVVVQRAGKRNSILVMVSSHVKKTFNGETTAICNFLNRVPIVNPFPLILPCCCPLLVFCICKRETQNLSI